MFIGRIEIWRVNNEIQKFDYVPSREIPSFTPVELGAQGRG
jgi:hypothetical protein